MKEYMIYNMDIIFQQAKEIVTDFKNKQGTIIDRNTLISILIEGKSRYEILLIRNEFQGLGYELVAN